MKLFIAVNEINNRININYSLFFYFVNNNNDSIIKVLIKLLWISIKDVTF